MPLRVTINSASGRAEFINVTDEEAVEAGMQLAKLEGIIPALESAHALSALKKLEFQSSDVVVLNLSGRGDKDLAAYSKHLGI